MFHVENFYLSNPQILHVIVTSEELLILSKGTHMLSAREFIYIVLSLLTRHVPPKMSL